MNFIAQVEEHLRDLGAEARKNHPGVKEASERAILVLRTLQGKYVTEVRKATAEGGMHPTTALFQSQDLLRPFLLAVNYPNASVEMLDISFRAIRLLIEGNAICPGDGIHLIRVWTIQAQVCAAQYNTKKHKSTNSAVSSGTPAAPSSSWFGGLLGGSSNTVAQGPQTARGSGVVSSSSGQPGTVSNTALKQHKKDHDRFAVEIMACLVMLLELPGLILTQEQWSASVALCCILLGIETSSIVPQAATSTLKGVLSILFQQNEHKKTTNLDRATWMDLLHLATCDQGKTTDLALKGAFCHCSLNKNVGGSGPNPPPSSNLCLELLHLILQQRPDLFGLSGDANGEAFTRTAVTLMDLLRRTQQFGTLWRLLQLACTIIQTQQGEWAPACRELLLELIYSLSAATDACRNHDDFEDGFIYSAAEADTAELSSAASKDKPSSSGAARRGSNALASASSTSYSPLIPDAVLWKAALVLEVIYKLLQEQNSVIFDRDGTLMGVLTEAISDFCTICASCCYHILQVVECASSDESSEPHLFHRAEELGKTLENGLLSETLVKVAPTATAGAAKAASSPSTIFPPCDIGEPVWISFRCILLISQSLKDLATGNGGGGELEIIASAMDGAFAPSLSSLQHYLKRFPGSSVIAKYALEGYANLSHVALQGRYGTPHQTKALVSSLCKLSLPGWGTRDSASQLQDHHVFILLCLLKIVHVNCDNILSQWQVVLGTLDELSTFKISSPLLTHEGYLAALDVSHAYARMAPLTASLSNESLAYFLDALAFVSRSSLLSTRTDRTVSDGEYVLPTLEKHLSREKSYDAISDRRGSMDFDAGNAPKDSIGGKLMNFAGRAMVTAVIGSSDPINNDTSIETKATERSILVDHRTKNSFVDDFRHDFAKRMGETQRTTNSDVFRQLPFALIALTDVAMSNVFRFDSCGMLVSKHLCSMAEVSPSVRSYAMDSLAMLVTSQITKGRSIPSRSVGPRVIVDQDPISSGLWIVKEADGHDQPSTTDGVKTHPLYHEDLLSPLCDLVVKTKRSDVAEAGITALHSILEGVGHNLNGMAWTAVIDAVESLSGSSPSSRAAPAWSTCCTLAFRCVKLIVDDFLNNLPPPVKASPSKEARVALLDCCSSFGSSRHDVNTSLTAIGMLWTIADQDPDPKSSEHAFSKLVFLSSDRRPEVRNCAVNTLFSCIVGRGQFSSELWKSILTETVFGVFDHILLREEDENNGISDNGSQGSRNELEQKSRYKVSVHHSRNSEDKQWATTQVMALRGLNRVLRSYFSQLLCTMTDATTVNIETKDPWFWFAWLQILEFGFSSTTQVGGRETLELRKAGVDLLILCNQLSCKHGIAAATTPARVGTNMEVVNGALRSVRATNAATQENENRSRPISKAVLEWRGRLFLKSFESLETLGDHLRDDAVSGADDQSTYIESTRLQVMNSLALGLSKLYECCKEEELLPNAHPDVSLTVEARFVNLATMVASAAEGEPAADFLTQAQRSCIDLLQTMISNASSAALQGLTMLAETSFLRCSENEDSDDDDETAKNGGDLLGKEASKVVTKSVGNESLSRESKVEVLEAVLMVLIDGGGSASPRKRCYDMVVPILQIGLHSASLLEEQRDGVPALDGLWGRVHQATASILERELIVASSYDASSSSKLCEILTTIGINVPARLGRQFCGVLSAGASNVVSVLETVHNDPADVLRVLRACLETACELCPCCPALHAACDFALQEALRVIEATEATPTDSNLGVMMAQTVCGVLRGSPRTQSLILGLFPVLCLLTGVDNNGLRQNVSELLGRADFPGVLAITEERAQAAEGRVALAESQIASLRAELADLQNENEALQQQVTVLSAASMLA